MATGRRIAVIGPHSGTRTLLMGSYFEQARSDAPTIPEALRVLNAGGPVDFHFGCQLMPNANLSAADLQTAVALAQAADYVVLALGISNPALESEGSDRPDTLLPACQSQLAAAVVAARPKAVVLVLVNGGILSIDELKESVPAIVEAFYPGDSGGTSIAESLFGVINRWGKLPVTIYPAGYSDLVGIHDYDMAKPPGRSYKYFTGQPLWPFGFGLSYTSFALAQPYVLPSRDLGADPQPFAVSVTVTNTGSRSGDEVVFAFFVPMDLQDKDSLPPLPRSKLFAFRRVGLEAGQSATLEFQVVPRRDLLLADLDGNTSLHPGRYRLEFTRGPDSEAVTQEVLVQGNAIVVWPFPAS
eukprot:NODE_730_length_1218_cov_126.943541_g485_i1.p1 GENE.NODE_730_length_1218_cov_126.943541_g485_i1~~NODE_730_length_1218_cov_126.943541_g485_i1.p1  ORF type:complete len:356 (+),score=95.09 NODE_730_length_1218_cov_126.943541_g485_i1:47-1114(+)